MRVIYNESEVDNLNFAINDLEKRLKRLKKIRLMVDQSDSLDKKSVAVKLSDLFNEAFR